MLWAMRQQLISCEYHVQIIRNYSVIMPLKCTICGGLAELYPEYSAWYCHPCNMALTCSIEKKANLILPD